MVTKTELKERAKKSAEEVIEEQKNGYPTKEDKEEKAKEVMEKYGDLNNIILNRSHTAGLKRVPEDFEIDNPFWDSVTFSFKKKKDLQFRLGKALGKIEERYGLEFNKEYFIKNIWNLSKTGFFHKGQYTIYVSQFDLPAFVVQDDNMLLIAPRAV